MIPTFRRGLVLSLLLVLVVAGLTGPAPAQGPGRAKHLTFTLNVVPADPFSPMNQANGVNGEAAPARGDTVYLVIKGKPQEGWYTYPAKKLAPGQPEGQLARIEVLTREVAPVGAVEESEPKLVNNSTLGDYYKYDGAFTWALPVVISPTAPEGKPLNVQVLITAQVCDKTCIIEEHLLTVALPVARGPGSPLSPEHEKALRDHEAQLSRKPTPGTAGQPTPGASETFNWRDFKVVDVDGAIGGSGKTTSLWGVIVTALIGGLISLITPCVFPMIPITVSFFLKQSETTGGKRALLMAAVYSGTLVLVLTAGGVVLGSVLQTVSQHWATNVLLTLVFIFFGLSLLGMFEIQLPSWLADMTSSREGQGGMMGIIFMALTFSIISFACVGPIYGSFTALSATSTSAVTGWTARIIGPLVFSLAFASPFFLLALFPQLLKTMPRSGSWMNTVKVVLGFLELAAAFKFVRAAELGLLSKPEYFTFDLTLTIYVALAIACGLYLLNVYRLPHDYTAVEMISVPRLVAGLIFISLGLYLLPGTFKDAKGHAQKPRGLVYEWTRSFLLPDDPMEWTTDLPAALAQAERENKPLFIDFTGQTCNNCKLNESRIFGQPKVEKAFSQFVTVSLHTDSVPGGERQVPGPRGATEMRNELFNNIALPYYVVLRPRGKTLYRVAVYDEGLISDADEFIQFLEQAAKVKVP